MKVTILGQTWDHPNELSLVNTLFDKINEILQPSSLHYSHLIVNGEKVFSDPYEYITEHIVHIESIEFVVRTMKEIINEIQVSAEEYLERALPQIPRLVDGFYQGADSDTWDQFAQLLEGIQWMFQMINPIEKGQVIFQNSENYIKLSSSLKMELKNLEDGVQYGDATIIGDILQYEIFPLLQSLKVEVGKTLDNEGTRTALN